VKRQKRRVKNNMPEPELRSIEEGYINKLGRQ
jgi:hypothetical protein